MTERHEVDEMIRVQMADQDRVERRRIGRRCQAWERPLAQIEQDGGVAEADE